PLTQGPVDLHYRLDEFDLKLEFGPTDFVQVNAAINQAMVARAIELLEIAPTDRVLDLYCGLGNFTLPIATRADYVVGIEGSDALVRRAHENAAHNALADKTEFHARNLFEMTAEDLRRDGHAQRWLVDPPREGAFALVKALADAVQGGDEGLAPRRIVYVSCNPATLARDAGLLVHQAGYRCVAAGAVNMFPHTAHVESIAVFERP
ncbi:MAG TPA: rRNA adenine N-6-methyltransferase family protein, partial [Burkholderiaceae bacterium]|nr:rRNA adenine N-6-methyltransferase family protein [Burkholderiaceae bacterium]